MMEPKCNKCYGEGVVSVPRTGDKSQAPGFEDKDVLKECSCAIIKRLAFSMPAEVRMAIVMQAHADHPITSMMNRSLYISSTYADILSVIKASIYKNNGRHVRTTTDAEIRNVGVGATSRKAKGEDARDVYNSFADLMETPPLVVVMLNKLGHKNVAAAGFLIEALTVRIDKRKPTWVVNDKDNPFGPGCFAYTEAVKSFLHMAFHKVDVPRILKFDGNEEATPQSLAPVRTQPALDVEFEPSQQQQQSIPKAEPPRKKKQQWPPKPVADVDDDLPAGMKEVGMGVSKSKTFKARE